MVLVSRRFYCTDKESRRNSLACAVTATHATEIEMRMEMTMKMIQIFKVRANRLTSHQHLKDNQCKLNQRFQDLVYKLNQK
uniref:Uncharacterized protein n=1 Tax=Oryza punctata TaxID=4537 RepID=A0A0E0LQH4_ORYPU